MKKQLFTLIILFTACIASAQVKHYITVEDFAFTPHNITINVGDTIQWTNAGGYHNVSGTQAQYPANAQFFTSGPSDSSLWSYQKVFTVPGFNSYVDNLHIFVMNGSITVKGIPVVVSDVDPITYDGDVEVYDMNGRMLYKGGNKSYRYSKGMYIVKMQIAGQVIVKKIFHN